MPRCLSQFYQEPYQVSRLWTVANLGGRFVQCQRSCPQTSSGDRCRRVGPSSDHYDPLAELTTQAQKNKMQLVQTPRADFFFLVRDDDLAVISKRPFLGGMVRRSGFQRVEGYVTYHRVMLEQVREMAANACRPRKNG